MGELALEVDVPGIPRPQGSMRLLGSANGQPRLRYSDTTISHRNSVIDWLQRAWGGNDPIDGPVAVGIVAHFPRPKSHYGTGSRSSVLKDSAPNLHAATPDGDKVARLILDALTLAGVVRDDSLVSLLRVEKWWGTTSGQTRIEVHRL